jgi:predicted GIY-YIG superfamily endonuclease
MPNTTEKAIKSALQSKIDNGEIKNMAQLLEHISSQGLLIKRNGSNYLGIQDSSGKRFRVHFSFANETRREQLGVPLDTKTAGLPEGYWIYGLFVYASDERACYIGQAVDYTRRARDHVRGREGRSSWELFQWAESRELVVQFALLDFVPGARMPALAAEATILEGLWLHRAQAAKYVTPGSERWGRLPKVLNEDASFLWPHNEIRDRCRPLREVLVKRLLPADLAIKALLAKCDVPGD